MKQDQTTYFVWVGASCDYGHKDRASAYAYIIERGGTQVSSATSGSRETTEFRMMLSAMINVMRYLPAQSDIMFMTNVSYVTNFDKAPTEKSVNGDLILECIEMKKKHHSVSVKIVPYHKSPLLKETHDMAREEMRHYQ